MLCVISGLCWTWLCSNIKTKSYHIIRVIILDKCSPATPLFVLDLVVFYKIFKACNGQACGQNTYERKIWLRMISLANYGLVHCLVTQHLASNALEVILLRIVMQTLSQLRNVTACRLKTSLQSASRWKPCGRPPSLTKHIPERKTQVACSQQTQKDPKACYYFPTLTTSQARGHHCDHRSDSKCEAETEVWWLVCWERKLLIIKEKARKAKESKHYFFLKKVTGVSCGWRWIYWKLNSFQLR